MERSIIGYAQDEERHWVALLACGHRQHVRHDPPWQVRPWVITPEGRTAHLGTALSCRRCDELTTPMPNSHITVTRELPFPPARVHGVIADYHRHHPAILPSRFFTGLEVLAGGRGEGTRFRLTTTLGGRRQQGEFGVTEPRPGEVLVESASDGSVVTVFTMAAAESPGHTLLTFATDYTLPGGFVRPLLEWITNRVLRKVYVEEMENLRDYLAAGRDR